ncbi:MAG TPA: transposase [Ktedonobacteraceae bacterium]
MREPFAKDFWKRSRELLVSRDHPSPAKADALRTAFDDVCGQTSGYQPLDERLARTRAKKDALLLLLEHPEILFHNNPAELGARQRVRKRDVSLQARTREGIKAWDTFQTLVETAYTIGVNVYQDVHDRITSTDRLPCLAPLMRERAVALHLGASWAVTP